jgi:hypothetical protein
VTVVVSTFRLTTSSSSKAAESAHAPMFDDNKVKVIVFPGVGIGSTLTLHYQRIQRKPLFPGHFFVLEYFSDGEFRESVQLTIRAPLSMNLHVDAVHLPGGLVASDQPGAQLWKWSLANCHARQPEMSSVSDVDYSPRIAVSTFVDFAAVGKAYLERAAPMARITPAIRRLPTNSRVTSRTAGSKPKFCITGSARTCGT